MSKESLCGSVAPRDFTPGGASGRVLDDPPPREVPPDLGALAGMCEAIGDARRLRLFQHIAQGGLDGVDAGDIDDDAGLEALVAGGVVTPVRIGGTVRYRAERNRLRQALVRLMSD